LITELSLYLHLPFCQHKCFYCDFNSFSGLDKLMPDYADALIIEMQSFLPQPRLIKSIYFGGGTPSYFSTELLVRLIQFIKEHFSVNDATEVTIEANPGTVHFEDLIMLHETGFNRLSLGLQATQDLLLQAIGRIHTWQDFLTSFNQARESGFTNIGVDLIFGLPGQTIEAWQDSLQKVTALKPEHISAYGLQLEPHTKLAVLVEQGSLKLPGEDEVCAMMQRTMDYLRDSGYEHYEISNFAKPGFHSIHNTGYWSGRNYLGFGAGASSTYHQERWANIVDLGAYIQAQKNRISAVASIEVIDHATAITEAVMLGLRMRKGIDLAQFQASSQIDLAAQAAAELERLTKQKLLRVQDGRLTLTDQGVLLSNYIIASLLASLEDSKSKQKYRGR
jgi:oxygen-independent coproporphyrinogen-3 oxidase